jgi:hypothetical protein
MYPNPNLRQGDNSVMFPSMFGMLLLTNFMGMMAVLSARKVIRIQNQLIAAYKAENEALKKAKLGAILSSP